MAVGRERTGSLRTSKSGEHGLWVLHFLDGETKAQRALECR